ncbi:MULTISPECIES: heme NO-binding domain-containing protein [unclassified Vibrio]|uniref:Heme NO-binding domain-containing protein n=1 Tax=Vibrio sp. HB236076 TaxID=3232307 RepID=A0AB39HLU3_9VIBR|nr:heme NO-binding domain-containing protein [Vibrio sp. HB161653]MDP5253127.1 heme NO-binding domain-containing protein [Vibrio sp. HB161653]
MKGIIFREFLELVEDKFGLLAVETVLQEVGSDGVYTTVGSYDHKELVKLIVSLSKHTGVDVAQLQQVFGETVFISLYNTIPEGANIKECQTTFEFIRHVEDYIHVEVKKLYVDAKPPSFSFISEQESELVFDYYSARCMADVCLGLVKGCANHFGERLSVEKHPIDETGQNVRFTLIRMPLNG